jgi:Bacteriophage head-tail adaptor
MKSGSLHHIARIEEVSTTISAAGTPVETWATLAELRAELVQASAEEFLRGQGAVGEGAILLRTRYLAGVTLAHRVWFQGSTWNIRELVPIGRNRGLELRCTRVAEGV